MNTTHPLPLASRWHTALLLASLLAIALYYALGHAGLPSVFGIDAQNIPFLVILLLGGTPLLVEITRDMAKGAVGADFLGALSLVAATLLGQYLAAVLILMMLTGGQALELYAMRRASSVLQALSRRMPAVAHRKQGTVVEDIALNAIALGDEILVYPHETAPVDGVVLAGQGSMDEAYLTGEPYQVAKAPGSTVLSGAINGDTLLSVRADKLAQESRFAQIMGVMQAAEQQRPQLRRLADQLGGWFSLFTLVVSGAVWLYSGDPLRSLSVLMIATPCPLIIAIPVTLIGAISLAARSGIIIKDPTVLERLPTCRTAIFDKTGTLTYGKPELTELLPAEGFAPTTLLQVAASLERYSKHPLASAILQAAKRQNLPLLNAVDLAEQAGKGLSGTVGIHHVQVTHRKALLQSQPHLATLLPTTEAGLECTLLTDGQYAATLRFRDAPRPEGHSFIKHLAPLHQFSKVMLVSGDRESEVAYLAKLLGITETLASQSPEQKVAIVRAETQKAPTLFMGDGINDAPALASATVGIAFGQHSAVTAEAAGAVILDNSLAKVDELLHISERLRSIALQSAMGGMVLSLVGMGFALAGVITPVQAALLQEAIDILAIANALRLSWGQGIPTDFET